ncbi:Cellulose biosynthesis protein BcsQ [Chitinophaga eiseniae]|uniref:Cellulose biosynthesis protein BcsQ n=1 Tax=Chitinophaga eiseniae TaxID=634771 RepID=A0A1T4SXU7_9BACT|nr:ParA family protein [Chitinophaga eiseniae]SKA33043.1 Cellulose biosynthesis protein BcsQ [Chitinophaga eiseniae]
MNASQKTKLIAISTQKGGPGKTTLTAMACSEMHYRLGYNVAAFDCDYPQLSLSRMRERDLKAVMHNEVYKKLAHHQFTSLNKKAYPIIPCRATDVLQEAEKLIATSAVPPDAIFFDLPGTVNTPGVLTTLAGVHHIFAPITADRVVVESTLGFIDVLVNVLMKKGNTNIETIHLFWNQVDGREKSSLYQAYESVISELGLSLMESFITDSKRFRKEVEDSARTVFRSTLLPANTRLMKGCKLDLFITELLKVAKF